MEFAFEKDYEAKVLFESSVAIGGYSYLVIYGKHINGYFCCVPNWKWGCEMAGPESVGYNTQKLLFAGASEEVASAIARAICEKQK